MKCVTVRRRPIPIQIERPRVIEKQQPVVIYNAKGHVEFKTTVGTKVEMIKSQCAPIVTISKSLHRFITLDDQDVNLIISWLIENNMLDNFKFKNVFEDSYKKHSNTS